MIVNSPHQISFSRNGFPPRFLVGEKEVVQMSEKVAEVNSAVVKIKIQGFREELKGSGSGFIIDKNGFVLTNRHVVHCFYPCEVTGNILTTEDKLPENFPEDRIEHLSEEVISATVPLKILFVSESAERDVALLKIDMDKGVGEWNKINFRGDLIYPGEDTFTIGRNGFTSGFYMFPSKLFGLNYIVSNPTLPGDSGSPCVDKDGNAFGMVTGGPRSFIDAWSKKVELLFSGFNPFKIPGVTKATSDLLVNQFMKRATGVRLEELREGKTLMSSDAVKRQLEKIS